MNNNNNNKCTREANIIKSIANSPARVTPIRNEVINHARKNFIKLPVKFVRENRAWAVSKTHTVKTRSSSNLHITQSAPGDFTWKSDTAFFFSPRGCWIAFVGQNCSIITDTIGYVRFSFSFFFLHFLLIYA